MSAGGTYISTASVEVPQALQDGEKFIRWDDVSSTIFISTDLICDYYWLKHNWKTILIENLCGH